MKTVKLIFEPNMLLILIVSFVLISTSVTTTGRNCFSHMVPRNKNVIPLQITAAC